MSKWLKAFLFGIWGLLLIPLIATILEKWLGENFLLSDPNAVAAKVSNNDGGGSWHGQLASAGDRGV